MTWHHLKVGLLGFSKGFFPTRWVELWGFGGCIDPAPGH